MSDIVPDLKNKIMNDFNSFVRSDQKLNDLQNRLNDGNVKYSMGYEFAERVGELASQALQNNLSAEVLPNGVMYLNISDRIIPELMKKVQQLVDGFCSKVTEAVNEASRIRIKSQPTEFNADKAHGLAKKVSDDVFEKQKWVLDEPIVTNSLGVVDDHIRAQADFHSRSGLNPQISRVTAGKCCNWCRNLAGRYNYPKDVPNDVFKRHENCRCVVEYWPGDGKHQDVWSKLWKESPDDIERRKQIGLHENENPKSSRQTGLEKHFEKHGKKEFGFETEAEYTKAVNDFWSRELSEIVQEIERKDGVRERYDFSTNEFSIIDKNGRVKTYFLPKRKGDYWKDEIRDKAILLNGRPIN